MIKLALEEGVSKCTFLQSLFGSLGKGTRGLAFTHPVVGAVVRIYMCVCVLFCVCNARVLPFDSDDKRVFSFCHI